MKKFITLTLILSLALTSAFAGSVLAVQKKKSAKKVKTTHYFVYDANGGRFYCNGKKKKRISYVVSESKFKNASKRLFGPDFNAKKKGYTSFDAYTVVKKIAYNKKLLKLKWAKVKPRANITIYNSKKKYFKYYTGAGMPRNYDFYKVVVIENASITHGSDAWVRYKLKNKNKKTIYERTVRFPIADDEAVHLYIRKKQPYKYLTTTIIAKDSFNRNIKKTLKTKKI